MDPMGIGFLNSYECLHPGEIQQQTCAEKRCHTSKNRLPTTLGPSNPTVLHIYVEGEDGLLIHTNLTTPFAMLCEIGLHLKGEIWSCSWVEVTAQLPWYVYIHICVCICKNENIYTHLVYYINIMIQWYSYLYIHCNIVLQVRI